jgi:hypothetical protein
VILDLAEMMGNETLKQVLAESLVWVVRIQKPKVVCLLTSAWMSANVTDPETAPRPSQDPERTEILVLDVFNRERDEHWQAEIYRDDEQPPALQRWEPFQADKVEGRFIDAIRAGLRD